MNMSNRLTLSFLTIFLLMAFVAVPVMAHQVEKTEVPGADDAAKTAAVNAHNQDPDDASDSVFAANHALVKSIVLSNTYLTRASPITATITYANGVASIADDPDTGTGDGHNEERHAILTDSAVAPVITFEYGTKGADGMYTYAAASGEIPTVTTTPLTRAAGAGATGSGAVYTAYISFPTTGSNVVDGQYRITVTGTDDLFSPLSVRPTFFMDTRAPEVSNEAVRAIGQNYANTDGEWGDPFEITFNLEDPLYDFTDDGDATNATANSASGLDLSTIRFEVKDADDDVTTSELTFSGVQYTGSEYVVTATPVTATSAKPAATVSVTVKVMDMAGNEGMSATPLSVKLAERAATGTDTGPGDTTPPTVTITSAKGAVGTADADKVIFTFAFGEALATTGTNAFTVADINISNTPPLVASNLATTDNMTYKLTVTPVNDKFPVKVSFKPAAKIGDAAGNVMIASELTKTDTFTPEGVLGVEIDAPTAIEYGVLTFTFTFAEEPAQADADGNLPAGAFTVNDVRATNAHPLIAANLRRLLKDADDDSDEVKYELAVTPMDATQPVRVQLLGRSVSNGGGDDDDDATEDKPLLIAGEVDATWTPPTPDTDAPVVSIMAPAAGSVNPLMFTIDFNEAISTVLMVDNLVITGAAATPAPALERVTTGLPATGVAQRYTLTVTGTPGTAVTVNLKMNAVMDTAENSVAPLATPASYTITDDRDTTAPTLTIMYSPADRDRLPTSGVVTFTFTFSEAPGSNDADFTLGDITIENGSPTDFVEVNSRVYRVPVRPADATQPVTVTVAASAVSDAAGNNLAISYSATYIAFDDVAPRVTITSAPGTGTDAGKVVFTFTFSEPLMSNKTSSPGAFTEADILRGTGVSLDTSPTMDPNNKRVYTVLVTPAASGPTVLTLRTGSVQDMAGNALVGDQSHTYSPDAPATIPTTALGNTTAGGMLTITFDKDPGVVTAPTGYTITGTGITRMLQIPANKAAGTHTVALTWAGGAGASDNGSGSVTYTIPAAPIAEANTSGDITIAANSYLVVVRNTTGMMGTLLRTYDSSIALAAWSAMPDLQNVFETGVPLTGPAHGGGALILRQSGTTAVHPGTVGISEIMWAINESHINDEVRRKADQWIELHNLNTTAVTVKLSWKTGAKAIAADTNINGDLAAPYLDVVTNVFHDRPGNAHWTLPGQNGNPIIGKNFVSAARKGTFDLNAIHDGKRTKRYTRTDKPAGDQKSKSADGRNKDQWEASTVRYAYRTDTITTSDNRSFNVAYEDHGTPGRVNTFAPERADTTVGRTEVPDKWSKDNGKVVIFNEIANRSNEAYEWIELRNTGTSEINLKNYLISIVEAKPSHADRDKPDNDKIFYQFPSNDKAKIAVGGVFLLVASDPRNNPDHPLAVGYNVDLDDEDQLVGTRKNPIRYKVMRKDDQAAYQYEGKGLPDSGKFILILRRPDNHEGQRSGADGGKGVAERGKDDLDKVVDVAGWHDDLKITNYPNVVSETNLWPLRNFEPLNFDRNKFNLNTVHHRTNLSSRGSHNDHRAAWQDIGYSGIGYKHQAVDSAAHGGTPGSHGNIKGKVADGKVIISEIMLSQGTRNNLPQWIELYNPSKTNAVNLADNAGWRLVIENPNRAPIITINFKNKGNVKYIPPNSTVLIVSSSARDYGSDTLPRGTVFPDTRVLNAYTAIRGETFEIGRGDPLLDPKAFNVRLLDGKTTNNKPDGRYAGDISDEIGNLDGNPRTNDAATWEFPSGMTADGDRTSLIRIFDDGVARDGTGEVEPLGGTREMKTRMDKVVDMKYSWVHAVDTAGYSQLVVRHTWFGAESDYGTPADRTGQTLPVELSHFRPTLENGEVVIRWTTESELDNAGFNILRSDARDGEFKQVNAELIQGHGTTGERHSYKWVDESAKPGVVYYYQIEDVSFAGERQVLTMTKLKGLISAAGKATTTWGELKEVQ